LSKYFSIDEFRSHDGAEYPAEWVDSRLATLCAVLDAIREAWGGPLTVVSGYRSAAYNARLASNSSGVAKNSQHIQGRASDIRPRDPTTANVQRLHYLIKELHHGHHIDALGGLGVYPGWVHVDIRAHQPGVLVEWTGVGVGSEQ